MKLSDYANSSTYEKLSDGEPRFISLDMLLPDFLELEPTISETFNSEQYEFSVIIWDTALKEQRTSVIATRSKKLLLELVSIWGKDSKTIIRIACTGTGYRATYTVKPLKKKPA